MTSAAEFSRFLEASRLTDLTTDAFVMRTRQWEAFDPGLSIFDQPGAEIALPKVDDRFQRLLAARTSDRSFNERPIPTGALAEVLAAVGATDRGPIVPSAGGLDPLGIHAIVRRGEGELDNKVVHYQRADHTIGIVGPAPDEDSCRRLFGLDCDGTPSLLVVISVDPEATVAKYGERGGRFLLQQTGIALANIGLRLSETQRRRRGTRLHGYIPGGLLDDITDHLQLTATRAVPTAAYAIGVS